MHVQSMDKMAFEVADMNNMLHILKVLAQLAEHCCLHQTCVQPCMSCRRPCMLLPWLVIM